MKNLGLGTRLALVIGSLVALTAAAISTASVLSTTSQVSDDIDSFLRDRAQEITSGQRDEPRDDRGHRDDLGDAESSEGAEAIREAVEADAIVQILDRSGTIAALSGLELPVEAPDLAQLDLQGETSPRTVSIDNVEYRMITRHIEGGGAVQVAVSLTETNQLVAGIRDRLFVIGLIAAATAAMAAWLIALTTLRPLKKLTASVEHVSKTQDLSTSVGVDRQDEIGQLASRFDEMLGALEQSKDQQHRLVQDAAHELRTPLTSVKANVDLLGHATELDESERAEVISSIRSELTELGAVFNEVIELATDARDAAPHVLVDLAEVARSAVAQFQRRATSSVDLVAASSTVSGDYESLERAVSNLIVNAGKYSPPDSRIVVVVNNGAVTVRDEGPGIPVAERPYVFDRFYRASTSRSEPGSGLGLSIVKKIASDHGGRVWVGDAPDGGAEVGFEIPTA